jgi:hypothetical protein
MKQVNVPFILWLVACLVSCAQNRPQSIGPSKPAQQGSGETPGAQEDGTMDGGGGNGIKGKPLESYRVAITETPEYIKYIKPISEKLMATKPDIGRFFLSSVQKKNWYFVPARLVELDPKRIGVPFRADQLALQNLREVWIDNGYYSKTEIKDKAHLLLHEIVMGMRLLVFDSSRKQCESFAPKLSYCEGSSTVTSEIQLTDQDYATIREVTSWIFEKGANIEVDALLELLVSKGFDNDFIHLATRIESTPETFKEILDSVNELGVLGYSFYYVDGEIVTKSKCALGIEQNSGELQITVRSNDPAAHKRANKFVIHRPHDNDPANFRKMQLIKDGPVYRIVDLGHPFIEKPQVGTDHWSISLIFRDGRLLALKTNLMRIVNINSGSCGSGSCFGYRSSVPADAGEKEILCIREQEVLPDLIRQLVFKHQ